MNLETGFVWVVLREQTVADAKVQVHLQGIFDDKAKAIECCNDESYVIGPVPLNTALPESRIEWVGAYFPRRP